MLNNIMYILNYLAITWIILIFLWLFFSVISKFKTKSYNNKMAIFISIFSFSVFAFNYKPTEFTDLYRLYETLDLIRYTGGLFYNSNEIITVLLFDIVSKTSYNQLLPFIVTIIRYSLFFLILNNYAKTYKIERYSTKLFIFFNFAFLPLIESISGIRYYFAITVLAYALISDFCLRKKILNKITFLIPLLIHTGSSIFLGLRLLVIDKLYKLIKPFMFIILFWTIFSDKIVSVLQSIDTEFTIVAANMLKFYIEEERTISLRLTIARFIMVIILYMMFFMIKKKDKKNYISNLKYYRFIELVLIFTFGSVFHAVLFQRNTFFIALISMPLFFNFFKSEVIENRIKKLYGSFILILSIGMYLNQIYGLFVGYF